MDLHSCSATELLARLEAGDVTSVDIVEALIARREHVDPKVNAFVLARGEALTEARSADEERAAGKLRGPLHGLPITIKENLDVVGTEATLGLQSRRGQPARTNAVLVDQLLDRGAIVLGKTNVPQLLLAQETENAIHGVTNNPWNLGRVPGGSSGGEAAAVASGMTPWGIGTDIGGSIRIPAHFCGVVGFKPTLDRWSNRGSQTGIPGQELVRSQIGCLARCVADAALLWTTLDPLEQSSRDPLVAPVAPESPSDVDVSTLTIGWFDEDEFLMPCASLRRALGRAKEVLEAAGATLVHHRPVPSEDVLFTWLSALTADGGRTIDARLAGEPISPQLKPSRAMLKLPASARKAASVLASKLGERRLARLLRELGEKTVDQVWALTQRRTDLRLKEFDAWREQSLDAVICPPHVVPALSHRQSGDFTLSLGAQFRWTLLNFPAGVVPVTRVRRGETGQYQANDRVEKKLAAIDAVSADLPVGVQVVARPYQEHVLLSVMAAIEAGVRDDEGFPRTPVTP